MNRDKKILYSISIFLFVMLSLVFFIPTNSTKIIVAALLIAYAIILNLLVKKKETKSIHSRQVLLLMSVIGLVYVMLYYLTGLHFGFYKASPPLSFKSVTNVIIPVVIVFFTSEFIADRLLDQHNKFVEVLVFLSLILIDISMFSSLSNIKTFNQFMDTVGLTLIPSVTRTLLFMYITKRYGPKPNVAFRLITGLYSYIIPFIPATPDSLTALVRLVVPLIVYSFIFMLYEKKPKVARKEKSKWRYLGWAALLAVLVGSTMLISNKFTYGMIVIATNSMKGELNKGDALIYESFNKQAIKEGQIILFEKQDRVIVHRVVEIVNIDSEIRYYTKGDANEKNDEGFIVKSNIIGLAKFKIPYVGYPSIWIRDIFSNN